MIGLQKTNLMFAAPYSATILRRWREKGFDISNQVEVFATLCNLGTFRKDGIERHPHASPQSNEHGYVAKDLYLSSQLTGRISGSICFTSAVIT